jgi:serine/threonine protein kinase
MICQRQSVDETPVCSHQDILSVDANPLAGSDLADDYEILSLVGAGGFGVVYKAHFKPLNRLVAVKCMHESLQGDHQSEQRFHRECAVLSKLQHPHITTVYKSGLLPTGQPYMVMEYLEGQSLCDILEESGALEQRECVAIFEQVCSALATAHQIGIIHRDIKPSNIFVNEGKVKVLDFGLAKIFRDHNPLFAEKLTKTQFLIGSPGYMSPEQCQGKEVDEGTDIYSLACSLYEAITGVNPFLGRDFYQTINFHLQHEASFRGTQVEHSIHPQLELSVLQGLSKDSAQRQQTAAEFQSQLQAVSNDLAQAGEAIGASSLPKSQRNRPPRLPKRLKSSLITVGISAAVILPTIVVFQQIYPSPKDGPLIKIDDPILDNKAVKVLFDQLPSNSFVANDPGRADLLVRLGNTVARVPNADSHARSIALKCFTNAARVYEQAAPKDSRYWNDCTTAYWRAASSARMLGSYEEGESLASQGLYATKKSISKSPSILRLLVARGRCQLSMNRTTEAYQTLGAGFAHLNLMSYLVDQTEEDAVIDGMLGFAEAHCKLHHCDKKEAAAQTEAKIGLSRLDKARLSQRFEQAWFSK